ncbi:hypothetical protein SAMN06296952_1142 [Oscillospiraceae bacterium]|nr:hypothetical protein SAMN06296952_1142 [Oscillospiraceae bacterium]
MENMNGKDLLLEGKYKEAMAAFEAMLEDDPHDFEALKGLVLASARVRSFADLNDSKNFPKFKTTDVGAANNRALGAALPSDVPYFEKVKELISKIREYKTLEEEITKLTSERRNKYSELNSIYDEQPDGYTLREVMFGSVRMSVYYFLASVIPLPFCVLMGFLGKALGVGGAVLFFMVMLPFIIEVVLIALFFKGKEGKWRKRYDARKAVTDEMTTKIKESGEKKESLLAEIAEISGSL